MEEASEPELTITRSDTGRLRRGSCLLSVSNHFSTAWRLVLLHRRENTDAGRAAGTHASPGPSGGSAGLSSACLSQNQELGVGVPAGGGLPGELGAAPA